MLSGSAFKTNHRALQFCTSLQGYIKLKETY